MTPLAALSRKKATCRAPRNCSNDSRRLTANRCRQSCNGRNQFLQMAEDRKKEAIELMNCGQVPSSATGRTDMSNISSSSVQGGAELMAEIRRRHRWSASVCSQKAGPVRSIQPLSWSSRRAGSLVYRPGDAIPANRHIGRSAYVRTWQDESRAKTTCSYRSRSIPRSIAGLTGFDLAQILSNRATPGDKDYDASWAAIVQSIASPGPTQVVVRLQKPYVLTACVDAVYLDRLARVPSHHCQVRIDSTSPAENET